MKRHAAALIALVATAAVFGGFAAGHTSPAKASGPLTGDFATAAANGWIDPADYGCTSGTACNPPGGIPWCTQSGDPSYPTPDALNAAVAASSDTPTCINDPRTSMTFVNPSDAHFSAPDVTPPPGSGLTKMYAGADEYGVSQNIEQGYRYNVEVGNPNVPHDGGDQFMAANMHVCDIDDARDDEVGWLSGGFTSGTFLYTEWGDCYGIFPRTNLAYYPLYSPLGPGQYIKLRIRDFGGNTLASEIYAFGGWQILVLDKKGKCGTNGVKRCTISDAVLEVNSLCYSLGGSYCYTQNAPLDGTGVNFNTLEYRNAPNDWRALPSNQLVPIGHGQSDPDAGPGDVYYVCDISKWSSYRTPKDHC